MNSTLRYILTRPCLSEGTLTVAKYLTALFPADLAGQTLHFTDEQDRTYPIKMSDSGKRLSGLGMLYHDHNLDVNDVLMIKLSSEGSYRVTCVVKPHTDRLKEVTHNTAAPATRRVVINATPHVREVRMERADTLSSSAPAEAESSSHVTESRRESAAVNCSGVSNAAQANQAKSSQLHTIKIEARTSGSQSDTRTPDNRAEYQVDRSLSDVKVVENRTTAQANVGQPNQSRVEEKAEVKAVSTVPVTPTTNPLSVAAPIASNAANTTASLPAAEQNNSNPVVLERTAQTSSTGQRSQTQYAAAAQTPLLAGRHGNTAMLDTVMPNTVVPDTVVLDTVAEQLNELAHLTGYQVEYLGGAEAGPVRLRADLGTHSYDVLLALSSEEQQHLEFKKGTYRALLTWEKETLPGTPRFTREALGALLEHARLAPLTPIDLRGYWNTSSFDLDSVASLAELVSAHLVQRGTFTYVLSILAQQPAHSVVDPHRLAERLGSGANPAELHSILETLCRAPFMALLPLPGGQFYLRSDVPALLGELADYAQGVSKRLKSSRIKA